MIYSEASSSLQHKITVLPVDTPYGGAKFCQFDGGVLCPFMEQMTNDDLDVEIVSGYQTPYGPRAASRGKCLSRYSNYNIPLNFVDIPYVGTLHYNIPLNFLRMH